MTVFDITLSPKFNSAHSIK